MVLVGSIRIDKCTVSVDVDKYPIRTMTLILKCPSFIVCDHRTGIQANAIRQHKSHNALEFWQFKNK